ncbi:MAG TPA: class I tRNA ligase family protein [Chitinophagaceae bacterium]|jgi:leucyl-tRNA synthetase|nr:class I tRNA ligase family protein [Chitinophagaceae bacterium]
MEYDFRRIEKDWQKKWKDNDAYKVTNDFSKPKYYVLDMFPYPSGAGLHVGHPLGYIASDIYSRYKRLKGFNVLHPMGFDSFGLPAEQYALDTGQHPAETTKKNIATFKSQLDNIGFCYDWSREVQTSDPNYYKWTQWIFLQLFNSYFCHTEKKALPISLLVKKYEIKGAMPKTGDPVPGKHFTAEQWNAYSEAEKADVLMRRRLAYCGYGEVNWCEALGTVLANDEVVNGVSERGGYPVVKKTLRQWYLRITEYADRLLDGLNTVDFSDAMKEMQSNWIGKSSGAEIDFAISSRESSAVNRELSIAGSLPTTHDSRLSVYTTRPDTIFGVDFMVIAPEHELIAQITSAAQKQYVDEYIAYVKSRSERERMAEKKITGVFTGAYALNPFDGREIPIWISEYVLAGYGTGAIMAVPCGDERDHKFANHFGIPITNIIGDEYNGEEANPTKDAALDNSGFLNGIVMKSAIDIVIKAIEERGIGKRKVNYKMRDAAFSRQRYWGEPFPITWKNGIAKEWEGELPLVLPDVEKYSPGPDGQGPLANIPEWVAQELETNTMPGYAGSSWYFLRYMDPQNDKEFCSRAASDYWNQVDLYIGGTEHAVGHLLYSRMWTKVLYDLNLIGYDEPYKRLVNQGMIQGSSRFAYKILNKGLKVEMFVSKDVVERLFQKDDNEGRRVRSIVLKYGGQEGADAQTGLNGVWVTYGIIMTKRHVDVNTVDGLELNIEDFKNWRDEYSNAVLITNEQGKFICLDEVEKMSKSKYNVVNPDDLVAKYGADTFRMYEMFLGPVEMSKPWDTKGIEGVHRFLKKFWRLFFDEIKGLVVNDDEPNAAEQKVLHNTIKRIESDTERFSFNTGVSGFMIATNELTDLKCHKRKIVEPLLVLLVPYAPHITEELWSLLGKPGSILDAGYPVYESNYTIETTKEYPVSINGKLRTTMNISLDAGQANVESLVLQNGIVQKWMEGKPHKKIIFVKGKMVNVVV